MSEPTAITAINEPLALIFSSLASLPWRLLVLRLFTIVIFPFRLLIFYPLLVIVRVLLVVFAPVIHVAAYGLSWVSWCRDVIVALQPVYNFFGVAATLGLVAGLTLALSSSFLTTILRLRDTPSTRASATSSRPLPRGLRTPSSDEEDHAEDQDELLAKIEDDSLSSDWQRWQLERSPSRRRATGLLAQTIHEESNDSEDDYL